MRIIAFVTEAGGTLHRSCEPQHPQRARLHRPDTRQPRCSVSTTHPAPASVLSRANLGAQGGLDFLSVSYDDESQTSLIVKRHVSVGGDIDLGHRGTLRPYLDLGVTLLGNDHCQQTARLQAAPVGAGAFTTTLPMDDVTASVRLGLDWQMNPRSTLSLTYAGDFADRASRNAGSLNLEWWF